jgi:hypothetical protein
VTKSSETDDTRVAVERQLAGWLATLFIRVGWCSIWILEIVSYGTTYIVLYYCMALTHTGRNSHVIRESEIDQPTVGRTRAVSHFPTIQNMHNSRNTEHSTAQLARQKRRNSRAINQCVRFFFFFLF